MNLKWRTRSKPEWPTEINGYPTRQRHGDCPGCGADEKTWCDPDCAYLDPMDYR